MASTTPPALAIAYAQAQEVPNTLTLSRAEVTGGEVPDWVDVAYHIV